MKEGWELKKLGEIGKVSMCKRILKKQTNTEGGIPFYKIGTFGKKANAYISKEIYDEFKSKYSFPNKGDILISASGTIGRRVIYDGKPAYFQDSNIVWIANDESLVLNEYLYAFYGHCDWNPSKGATISRLYNDDLRRIDIPIPPLPEQKQIVTLLDSAFAKIDEAKANIEKNIANAKELFQSKLNEIFSQPADRKGGKGDGWEEKTLGELANFKNGLNFKKTSKGETVKLVGVADFKNRFEVPLSLLKGIQIAGSLTDVYHLKDGDILTVRSNGNPNLIGRCILATGIREKTSHSGFTIRIRPNSNVISPTYLCHFLKSSMARNKLVNSGTGISIKSLNQGALSSLIIPFPSSIKVQEELSIQLFEAKNKINELESKLKLKSNLIEELKKSLLQKAFAGELTQLSELGWIGLEDDGIQGVHPKILKS